MKKKPGPKTALDELTVAPARPQAPEHLSPGSQAVWVQVTDALPADWFDDKNFVLLEAYCNHVTTFRAVQVMIETMEQDGIEDFRRYKHLTQIRGSESRVLSSLATRMRLSQQSQYDKTKSSKVPSVRMPHESV